MIWQDAVITAANIVFSVSLIPQVYHGLKHKTGPITLHTSAPTFIGLFAISFTFWTLSLFFSSVISFITGILWFVLFLQRVIYKK